MFYDRDWQIFSVKAHIEYISGLGDCGLHLNYLNLPLFAIICSKAAAEIHRRIEMAVFH